MPRQIERPGLTRVVLEVDVEDNHLLLARHELSARRRARGWGHTFEGRDGKRSAGEGTANPDTISSQRLRLRRAFPNVERDAFAFAGDEEVRIGGPLVHEVVAVMDFERALEVDLARVVGQAGRRRQEGRRKQRHGGEELEGDPEPLSVHLPPPRLQCIRQTARTA